MKILRVIASADPVHGGPIEGIKQVGAELARAGVEVEVACCDDPASPWLRDERLPTVHALGPRHSGYAYSPRLLPWLDEHIGRFDAVTVHGLWQFPGVAVRRAARRRGLPYFVFPHGMLDPWFRHAYPLKHLKKWLYWPWGEYRVLRDAARVVFTCEEERLRARESFWLYRACEAVTAYGTSGPPAEADGIGFLRGRPDLAGKRIILSLGRLHEKKGLDLLLRAFQECSAGDTNLHLVLAGPDGGAESGLRSLASTLGIADRVTWTGMLAGRAKWDALLAAEVFCLPSHQENFGVAVAEALACGKPVLISNKVNIWREIDTDGAGYVDADSTEGTASNLRRWLELDETGRAAMGRQARSTFERRFMAASAAESLIQLVQSETKC